MVKRILLKANSLHRAGVTDPTLKKVSLNTFTAQRNSNARLVSLQGLDLEGDASRVVRPGMLGSDSTPSIPLTPRKSTQNFRTTKHIAGWEPFLLAVIFRSLFSLLGAVRAHAPSADAIPFSSCLLQGPLGYSFAVGRNPNIYLLPLGGRRKPHPTKEIHPSTLVLRIDRLVRLMASGDGLMPVSRFDQADF